MKHMMKGYMIRVQDLYIGYVASIYRTRCIYISVMLHL